MASVYRLILAAGRREGLTTEQLPDFLGLESGGDLLLLGQEELNDQDLTASIREVLVDSTIEDGLAETERILMAAMRVGQHRFARTVLQNCGHTCVFCGFAPPGDKTQRLLVASHIKPWSSCQSSRERLDHRNGLAACPTHDVAFDQGLLAITDDLRIHLAPVLQQAVVAGDGAQYYFARPPLRERLLFPQDSDQPQHRYLRWHKEHVFGG